MKQLIREFFAYSRSERRGIAVLLAVVVTLLGYLQFTGDSGSEVVPAVTPGDAAEALRAQPVKRESRDTLDYALRKFPARKCTGYAGRPNEKYKRYKKIPEQYHIDINTADSASLLRLRGIGRVLSARIVKYRNLLGGFVAAEQLLEVYGIDSALYGSIRQHLAPVTADADTLRARINLRTAGYRELARHPYIAGELASAILSYRKRSGGIGSAGELLDAGLLDEKTYQRLAPYLTAE